MGNDKSVSMLCIFCEQSFSTNEEMMHHMLFHNVTKPFLCIECNQRYAYKGVLKRHMSIHLIKRKIIRWTKTNQRFKYPCK